MEYICKKTCQHKEGKQIYFCEVGHVYDFKDKVIQTTCLVLLKEIKGIDFLTASQSELTRAKWDFEEAKKAIGDQYGVELDKGTKKEVVKQIIDARFRSVNSSSFDKVAVD